MRIINIENNLKDKDPYKKIFAMAFAQIIKDKKSSVSEISEEIGISKFKLYRLLKGEGGSLDAFKYFQDVARIMGTNYRLTFEFESKNLAGGVETHSIEYDSQENNFTTI